MRDELVRNEVGYRDDPASKKQTNYIFKSMQTRAQSKSTMQNEPVYWYTVNLCKIHLYTYTYLFIYA